MQSPVEPHARDRLIDLGSVQKHLAYHLQGSRQVRHQLRMDGLRQSGSDDEGHDG